MQTPADLDLWPYVYRGVGPRQGRPCRITKQGNRRYIAVEFQDGRKFMCLPMLVRRAPVVRQG